MYLLLAPSDILYVTGVAIHEVGEVIICIMNNEKGIMKNEKGIIFCDPRTSGLFDSARFEIIETREGWGEKLKKYKKIFTDPDYLTQTLREKIAGYGPELVMRKSPITALRMIKTPEEIAKLQESQRMNRAVYEAIQPFLQIGITEQEIARRIQILQLELGASGPSFPPIVAFGENTAVPHHSPTNRQLQSEDIILIDMGVIYQGYCSDMTRCIYTMLGDDMSDVRRAYTLLMDVTNHIISWAKPGMRMCDLDREARRMLGKYSKYFSHSLGHGIGLEIHESPRVSGKSREILRPGMVITIEPGIYFAQNNKEEIIKKKEERSIATPESVIPAEAGIYREETGMDSTSRPSTSSGLGWNDGKIYGLRYEEMVFVDKEKLRVL